MRFHVNFFLQIFYIYFLKHFLLSGVRETIIRNCEESVVECFENVPYLKLLWDSMQSMGCKVNLSRNISCELCQNGYDLQYQGNYDEDKNQVKNFEIPDILFARLYSQTPSFTYGFFLHIFILFQAVICANNNRGNFCGTLMRQMISMFDQCAFKNQNTIEHLACTEVRKANLAACNPAANLFTFHALPRAGAHKECVRNVATHSLYVQKFAQPEEAIEAVDKVIDKCYLDLEPIGRRANSSQDMIRAYQERYLFGYI